MKDKSARFFMEMLVCGKSVPEDRYNGSAYVDLRPGFQPVLCLCTNSVRRTVAVVTIDKKPLNGVAGFVLDPFGDIRIPITLPFDKDWRIEARFFHEVFAPYRARPDVEGIVGSYTQLWGRAVTVHMARECHHQAALVMERDRTGEILSQNTVEAFYKRIERSVKWASVSFAV